MTGPYYQDSHVTLWHGDCREVMTDMPTAQVDAVITDPPYELGFMGKRWDVSGIAYDPEVWAQCLRVLKPGGHLLSFGGTRTYHRMACAVENAGFEIRDSLCWLYGQGMPKGNALKPGHEAIVLARRPLSAKTVAANVAEHGTGALGIEACRIEHGDEVDLTAMQRQTSSSAGMNGLGRSGFKADHVQSTYSPAGRWPANVVLDEAAALELDTATGVLTSGSRKAGDHGLMGYRGSPSRPMPEVVGDTGGASRFFYTAKADQHQRPSHETNAHPTVKPLDLMRWLVRLITPPGGTALDPFAGSGTTAEACIIEGFHCITIEKHEPYLPLIVARLTKPIQPSLFGISDPDDERPDLPPRGLVDVPLPDLFAEDPA